MKSSATDGVVLPLGWATSSRTNSGDTGVDCEAKTHYLILI